MRSKWIFGVAGLLAAVLAVAAVGCNDDDKDETPAEAESEVCTDLGDLVTAVQGVKALNAQSTVDDAQSAVEDVQTAWDNLKSSAQDLKQADKNTLDSSVEDLQNQIGSASGSETLADAAQDLAASADQVKSDAAEVGDGLDCAAVAS